MILHLRVVPGFWVAVEEIRRPELRRHPVILGGLPHQRGVVREASFPAQQRGVRPGMTLSEAHQRCPEGIFLTPDPASYEAIWEVVCDVLRRYTPLVEPLEMGQAACDLSGCERLWGDGLEAARVISRQIHQATGITPWLGVASNRLVAQLASTVVGAEGISVIEPGQEQPFLADLPLTLLPGIDPRLALAFQVLGLRTIGQLAVLPAASVKQRFGAAGERLHAYARGLDPRPVVLPPSKPSVSARHECEEGSPEEAVAILHRLADRCATELQKRGLAGMVVEVTLEFIASAIPSPPDPLSLNGRGGEGTASETPNAPPAVNEEHKGNERFPIPYRIHSWLPQPPTRSHSEAEGEPMRELVHVVPSPPLPFRERGSGGEGIKLKTVVRTPVDTAPRLAETAQRLLLQRWSGAGERRLRAIELRVSEFPGPKQLSFTELNRIDQVGGLSGMSAERLQGLAEQEQVLAARYGDASFRHVARVDPGNILTERRVHWQSGLPWRPS